MYKTYIVSYRPRGANYNFMTPYQKNVRATSKKDAKEQVIMSVGDIYRIVKVVEA